MALAVLGAMSDEGARHDQARRVGLSSDRKDHTDHPRTGRGVERPMQEEATAIAMRDRLAEGRLMASARAEGARKGALVDQQRASRRRRK